MFQSRVGSRVRSIAVTGATMLAAWAGPASADLVATDSYIIGTGAYTAGMPLKSEPAVGPSGGAIGFGSLGYTSGSGSGNWNLNTGGLYLNNPNNAGEVSFQGYTGDTAVHSVARALTPVTTPSTLWFSITVSQDGSSTPVAGTNGYALAGFGNSTPPTLGATTNTGLSTGNSAYLSGIYFGFAHEPNDPTTSPNADLVIRYRDTTGYTANDTILVQNSASFTAYTIVAEVQVNAVNGNQDLLTYWLDPTNTSSVATMDTTSMMNNDGSPVVTYAFQGNTTADLARLNYSAQNWGGDAQSANFGDPTVGTTLADVAPATVPEPASIVMVALGLVGGLGLANHRRRALSR